MIPADQLLGEHTVDQLRLMVVERGATWQPNEKKADLIGRIIGLNIAAQANDKVNRNAPQAVSAPKITQPRMTKDQAKRAAQKWLDRGCTIKFSPDGTMWYMEFDTGKKAHLSGNEYVSVVRRDSGNMAIPPEALTRCGEMLVRPKADENRQEPPERRAVEQYVEE